LETTHANTGVRSNSEGATTMSETREELVRSMTGRWAGDEAFSAGDAGEQTAWGEFESTPVLGGHGIASNYVQTDGDVTTLLCHTLFKFGPGDAVTMTWTPSTGEPMRFDGRVTERVIDVERQNDDGSALASRMDYSDASTLSTEMTLTTADGSTFRTFRATYGKQPPVNGRQVWRDLTVGDADSVRDFYTRVLGWRADPVDMGDHDDYNMLDELGEVAAGVCHALGPNADLPPAWLIYFQVASVDEAITAAEATGGRVITEPKGFGSFRYVVLADPAGAHFVACEGSAF
jgi:predicted enzyme related to lactoylglutathione lyase